MLLPLFRIIINYTTFSRNCIIEIQEKRIKFAKVLINNYYEYNK
jgi:hypothetical protein